MSITKINIADAAAGPEGQHYLVEGSAMALRAWREDPMSDAGPLHSRDYETVGYVVSGRVELEVDGETVTLESGDSWCVPKGAARRYRVLETLTAIEATHPAAREAGDAATG